jgi:prepilin-type N-terminal cleavage/methylation domain-containing protein
MRNEKGFTLVELMVAFAVFAMVLSAAVAFYQVQSKTIAGSSKRKTAHEVTTAALAAVRKDIMQAGTGLRGTVSQAGGGERDLSHLSIFVEYHDAMSPTSPDKLYLNCTDYLDMSLPPGADYPNSFFVDAASPAIGKTWFELDSGQNTKSVEEVHANVNKATMSKAIFVPDTPGPASVEDLELSPDTLGIDSVTNTQTLKLQFKGTSGKRYAAPAIVYELVDGKLQRNGETMIGGVERENAGLVPEVKVTDFKIRCQFKDSGATGGVTWADLDPTPGGMYTPGQIVLVEVSLRYLVRDVQGSYETPDVAPGSYRIEGDYQRGPWAIGGLRTIEVNPRCLVLMQYL